MGKLEELMKCPVDWEAKLGPDCWKLSLPHLDWYHSFSQVAVDAGDLPFYPEEFESIYDDPWELKSLLINLAFRRSQAEELYMSRAGRLGNLNFMTPREHGKHFRPRVSSEDTLEQSQKGMSLFFEDHSSIRLEKTFWSWLFHINIINDRTEYEDFLTPEEDLYRTPEAALWRRFLSERNLRICANVLLPVGACDGRPTSFLCYDIHFHAKTAHCFPVSEEEARRMMGDLEIPGIDTLTC
jgi:hypothetical protein